MENISLENTTYSELEVRDSLQLFHLLRNEIRFKILCLLLNKEYNVSELEIAIQESQSAISHQLSLLKNAKLVKSKRVGRKQYYRIYDDHIKWIIYLALSHTKERSQLN
ncbi:MULTISPECIES: metalloregulator ArsR/SmtB family transcription factor [Vagococcus]|uniref:Cadmium efflux system accessory protein n=1 Tax=Vagococcus fluvialis bH819 TaxID=1255619 RepID=A0A1X6WPP0_9ENTE|nr:MULTISPECIES: metalloregulator ArsR/SmtB family transcription factor [Vagococcus]SLM86303.1 Cadmium efflux system accessory protein [Vagococcus fluvialis bH819]HCM88872.1 transcriptional regulator [Vagococcus sp.]